MLKQSVLAGQAAPEKPWSTGIPRVREPRKTEKGNTEKRTT